MLTAGDRKYHFCAPVNCIVKSKICCGVTSVESDNHINIERAFIAVNISKLETEIFITIFFGSFVAFFYNIFFQIQADYIGFNLLEYCGYKTQLLEFIDFDHTPKNILIRAVLKNSNSKAVKEKALREVKCAMEEFNVQPTLYKLLFE